MATYTDMQQRDLDCASGAAMDRPPTLRELAEHYDGRVPQWFIEASDDNERVVFCDACDGTGRNWYDGVCGCCDGTGYETITVDPIEIEDLPPC